MARDRSAHPPADKARGLGSWHGEVCSHSLAEPGLPFTPDLCTCGPGLSAEGSLVPRERA